MKLKPVRRSVRHGSPIATRACEATSSRAQRLDRASRKGDARISDLQRVFYADARHASLIVLQGRDAAGKDGTIRKVFSAVTPRVQRVELQGPNGRRAPPRLFVAACTNRSRRAG